MASKWYPVERLLPKTCCRIAATLCEFFAVLVLLVQDPVCPDASNIRGINLATRIIFIALFHGLEKEVAINIRACAARNPNNFIIICFSSYPQGLLLHHLHRLKGCGLKIVREFMVSYQVFEDVFDEADSGMLNLLHEPKDQIYHHGVVSF